MVQYKIKIEQKGDKRKVLIEVEPNKAYEAFYIKTQNALANNGFGVLSSVLNYAKKSAWFDLLNPSVCAETMMQHMKSIYDAILLYSMQKHTTLITGEYYVKLNHNSTCEIIPCEDK